MENIEHVILLTPENRSFHYILGFLESHTDHFNFDIHGNKIYCSPIEPLTGGDSIIHDIGATTFALQKGFILSNQLGIYNREAFESTSYQADPQQIMGYAKENSLPIYHQLARNFCVCTRWFSSVPTETFPNRSYMVAATTKGRNNNIPKKIWETVFDIETIFSRLSEKNISWKIYYPDYLDLITNLKIDQDPKNFSKLDTLISDIKKGILPVFSYVELDTNDDSIPELVPYRNWVEAYIGKVYRTIRNSKYWKNSLIIITFDEHGGFYDPIIPPPAISPDTHYASYQIENNKRQIFKFDHYGVRVPAILVSPWVDSGMDDTIYDHTSVLAFLEHRFGLEPLTQRDKNANYQFKFRTTLRKDYIKIPKVKITLESEAPSFFIKIMRFITYIISKFRI